MDAPERRLTTVLCADVVSMAFARDHCHLHASDHLGVVEGGVRAAIATALELRG